MTEREWNERGWAEFLAEKIQDKVKNGIRVESGKRLVYANEIRRYFQGGNEKRSYDYNRMEYETDILVYQVNDDSSWVPRVVIETKVNLVSTHDAITYSQKALSHKQVHPYLRYGMMLGNSAYKSLPGRMFRHGVYFDFMALWENYEPTRREWKILLEIIESEIEASQNLEDMIFNARKQDRSHYVAMHKPLVLDLSEK